MSERSTESGAVDVAIVTHQSVQHIGRCLNSVEASTGVSLGRVAVVDNASTDGTCAVIAEEFPSVDLTESRTNLGFSSATNLAASRGDSEFLLALNPDVWLEPDTLQILIAKMRSNPEIGISGCRLVLPDGSEDHAARRSFPTPLSALSHFAGISKRRKAPRAMREYLAPAAAGGGQVDAVNGALMLIRRKWFEDLGGFDERYWMYMEDLDLCWRFAERNRLTWFVPETEAVHVKGASSGRFRPLRLNWAFHSGMIRFYRDHLASEHNPLYNWAIYLGVLIKFSFSALRSAMGRVAGSDGSR